MIVSEFTNLGCDVEKEETEYIQSERYLVLSRLMLLWVIVLFFVSAKWIHPLLAVTLIVAVSAFWSRIYPWIELKLARTSSNNVVATMNPENKERLMLCGHYDSSRVIGGFARRYQRAFIGIAPFMSLVLTLYPVLLFGRGIGLLIADGFDVATLFQSTDGMTGLWGNVWLFYVILFSGVAVAAIYSLFTYLSEKVSYGADDNASGVAVMLEVARILRGIDLNLRVDFACFAAEEKGLFGSRKWVNKHVRELDRTRTYVLNLDCVGRGKTFFINKGLGLIFKKRSDPMLFDMVCNSCVDLGYSYREGWGGASDHAEFVRKKLRCCAIMRCDEVKANVAHKALRRVFGIPIRSQVISFMDWIHTEDDVVEHIDEERLNETTKLVMRFIEKLNDHVSGDSLDCARGGIDQESLNQ
ncbi:MAG: M28 family peptidase [Chloroflexota bacterium]|nr:M28 family peptidase [Chloroflexota bacterium]